MNNSGTSTTLVHKVRTFADDVRRAKERSGEFVPTQSSVPPPSVSPVVATPVRPAPPHTTPLQASPNFPVQGALHAKLQQQMQQTSHLEDAKGPLDIRKETGNTPQEGTIITDTRKKQWTLTGALSQSLNSWVAEKANKITGAADKKYSEAKVAPSQTRATVIQAARQKSALAPRDDRSAVVEKLRTFAQDAERATGKPYTLIRKPTPEEITPTWSSAKESTPPPPANENLATIQQAVRDIPSPIKQARKTIRPPEPPLPIKMSGTPVPSARSLAKDVAPAAPQSLPENVFVQLPQDQRRPPEPVAPMAPATPTPYGFSDVAPVVTQQQRDRAQVPQERNTEVAPPQKVVSVPPETTMPVAPPAPSRDIVFEKPVFAAPKTTNFRTYRADAIHDVAENKRSIPNIAAAEAVRGTQKAPKAAAHATEGFSARPFVIAGIVMIVIIAVGGFGFFWYASHRTEDTTTVSIPTFMAIDAQKSVLFSSNRATLLDMLNTEVRASKAGITQIYPMYTESQNGKPSGGAVTTSDFMYVLDPRASGSFIRNLDEEMMFGAYKGKDPFFIFKTNQFDTAFAGMLEWEQYMSVDLTPLFGNPVDRTLDTASRTIDQTRTAYFVDDTLQNVDVRILYDETGAERILYAFLNKNTLIITTSSAALIELIGRLQ